MIPSEAVITLESSDHNISSADWAHVWVRVVCACHSVEVFTESTCVVVCVAGFSSSVVPVYCTADPAPSVFTHAWCFNADAECFENTFIASLCVELVSTNRERCDDIVHSVFCAVCFDHAGVCPVIEFLRCWGC